MFSILYFIGIHVWNFAEFKVDQVGRAWVQQSGLGVLQMLGKSAKVI